MTVAENLKIIKEIIPQNVKLVAVSKTHPVNVILEAYKSGHKIFGENKAQELGEKHKHLPTDIEWHMIGHLQTNKIKYIASFVHLIHSVDSIKLLDAINNEALKINRVIDCLLQIKIAREETKFGFDFNELVQLLETNMLKDTRNVRITGLMGMASFTGDMVQVKQEFDFLAHCFVELKKDFFADEPSFKELSMGMSDDYPEAIKAGATIIRVGSHIFGKREYTKIK